MKTLDNAEYAAHKVLGAPAIERVVAAMKLDAPSADALRKANDDLAETEYMTKLRDHWKTSNAKRATRSERARAIRYALVMMLARSAFYQAPCECAEGSRICELCAGLRVLGIDGQWFPDKAMQLLESEANAASLYFDEMTTRFDPVVAEDDFGGA